MDEHTLNETLKVFWDTQFQALKEPMEIKKVDFVPTNALDDALVYLGDHTSNILDIGAGSGYAILTAIIHGKKVKHGVALEPSHAASNFLKMSLKKSDIHTINVIQEDHTYVKTDKHHHHYDGIICSNVLDVVPKQTSLDIIKAIDYSLKPGGLLLIKLNFYLTDTLIDKLKMTCLGDNMYAINNVLRGLNYDTATWITMFKGYKVIKQDAYERLKNGPKDRLILMRKPF
ncbi:MAG: class I SAM-dependent methyltransferase [Bacillota bacterium]